jgi:hypothetical protein
MKEADWLKAKQPETMLELVAPHLSPRQWNLLACMFVRRLGKLLTEPGVANVVAWAERRPGSAAESAEVGQTRRLLAAAIAAASDRARAEQREIVLEADPDADPQSFHHVEGRKTNPSAPLFQAASERARRAIAIAGTAVAEAGEAIDRVLTGVSSIEDLSTAFTSSAPDRTSKPLACSCMSYAATPASRRPCSIAPGSRAT